MLRIWDAFRCWCRRHTWPWAGHAAGSDWRSSGISVYLRKDIGLHRWNSVPCVCCGHPLWCILIGSCFEDTQEDSKGIILRRALFWTWKALSAQKGIAELPCCHCAVSDVTLITAPLTMSLPQLFIASGEDIFKYN